MRELAGEIRRLPRLAGSGDSGTALAVHMSCPPAAALSGEVRESFETLRRHTEASTFHLWSGGVSGAPAALLTREELEWEVRWSETNEDGTGLEQLFRQRPEAVFPFQPTPRQAITLADTTGRPVCAGYELPPLSGAVQPFWVYRAGRWQVTRSLFFDLASPLSVSRQSTPPEGVQDVMLHLALAGSRSTTAGRPPTGSGLPAENKLPEPALLVDQLLALCAGTPELFRFTGGTIREATEGERESLPPLFAATVPPLSPVLFHLGAVTAAPLRRTARLNREKIRSTLRALCPFPPSTDSSPVAPSPSALREHHTPEEFQGSTEGHLMMQEETLTVRFASGRIAGIADTIDGSTLERRALGYLRINGGLVPRTAYLTTDSAAWFSGTHLRGTEERATLELPGMDQDDQFELLTTTIVREHQPGVVITFALRFPRSVPRQECSLATMQIPLFHSEEDEATLLEVIDDEGQLSPWRIPPGEGQWTVPASLLRIPLPGGRGLWIGSAEPGQRTVIPLALERTRAGEKLLLSIDPVFRFQGVLPPETARTLITGSIILAPGSRDAGSLRAPPDADRYLRPFSRTVPE